MKTIQSGEFKNNFAHFLERAMKGEEFIVSYGRKKKKVARFVLSQVLVDSLQ
jgi:antitoxin (DNA-binding transcriptional repressor) of toxin-antitoxin stability system